MEAKYAPPDDPVFELVPLLFHERADILYSEIGRPPVSSETFWSVYRELLQQFHNSSGEDEGFNITLTTCYAACQELVHEGMEILPHMKEFRNGSNIVGPRATYYVGGLEYNRLLDDEDPQPEYAGFTSEEEDGDESD